MKAEKPNLKKEQGAKTKRKLYLCAGKLFQRYQYDDVSVERIAKAAGITKATFYSHFRSKDELYLSLFADCTFRIDQEYQTFLDTLPADLPATDRILALVEKIADILIGTVGYDTMKVIYKLELTKDVNTEAIKGYDRKIYGMVKNILDQGFHQGEFQASLPLEELTRQFLMAIRGVCYEWCIRYPDFDLKVQAVTYIKILLNGIQSTGAHWQSPMRRL